MGLIWPWAGGDKTRAAEGRKNLGIGVIHVAEERWRDTTHMVGDTAPTPLNLWSHPSAHLQHAAWESLTLWKGLTSTLHGSPRKLPEAELGSEFQMSTLEVKW